VFLYKYPYDHEKEGQSLVNELKFERVHHMGDITGIDYSPKNKNELIFIQ
jgi:hypothetical protein